MQNGRRKKRGKNMIKVNPNKNIFKSIVATDRYGIQYVKNFIIFADGIITVQTFDSNNTKVKTKLLKHS